MPPESAVAAEPSIASKTAPAPRYFYGFMAVVAFAIVIAGFGPGLVNTSARKAPLNFGVAFHGLVFTAWLVLFLVQSVLIRTRQVAAHRRLGYAAAALAVLMIVTGYITAIEMARRGFDLSGELRAERAPLGLLVFQLGDLLAFAVLVALGVAYRGRPEAHKRFLLLATVGPLMGAPLTHFIAHNPALRDLPPPIILVPLVLLYSAHAVYDRLSRGKIHPISLWGAIALFVWANLRAAVIGPNPAWRKFAAWLVA